MNGMCRATGIHITCSSSEKGKSYEVDGMSR